MKHFRIINLLIYFALGCLVFFCIPTIANAATLYFEPSQEKYGHGDIFAVDIYIDVQADCINTVEGFVSFTHNFLLVEDFLIGDSLINIWVDKPSEDDIEIANQAGVLHFSGGIPGGYCGRIPGDPGRSNKVARIIFKIPSMIVSTEKKSELEIKFLEQTRVLLNDGQGTEDNLVTKNSIITLMPGPTNAGNKWKEEIISDKIQPEPFEIELQKRDDIFDGRYFINFFTIDKQSGIDYYEVLEIKPNEQVGIEPELTFIEKLLGKSKPIPDWKRGEIPYLLQDQTLQSIIRVRAIDKAGNKRVVEYIPPEAMRVEPGSTSSMYTYFVLLFIIVVIVFIIFFVIKKIKSRKNAREE